MKKTIIIIVLLTMFSLHASKPTEVIFTLDSSVCMVPSFSSKSKITKSNVVVIGWNSITPKPKKYEFLIVPKGKSPIISNAVYTRFSSSNSIEISGLNKNEFFEAYVRSVCDNSINLVSDWSEKIQFRIASSNTKEENLLNIEINDLNLDKSLEDFIKIYPNPATSKFKLQGLEVDNIELYNILGSKVLEVRNTNSVTVSNLNRGAYLVKITVKGISVTKKLIITE